jgi:DNA polymerase-3 subunit alpha
LFFKGSPDNRSESDWFPTTQWDMYDCEDRGLLKMDYLGLKTLRVIDQTQKAINHILKALGKEPNFHIDYVDREDEKTWKLLAEGRLAGVFQVERGFVREFARRMNLAASKDPWQLAILVAIIRPGMMDSGNTEAYLRRASGLESPDAPHPLLKDTFKRSLGLMCFQEDVMSTCEDFSGMTKAEADVIRKGVGKKNKEFITKQQPKFFEGAKQPRIKVTVDKKVFVTKPRNPAMQEALASVGFEIDFKNPAQPTLLHKKAEKLTNVALEVIAPGATHEECEHIWHLIEAHSRYSFNNAHAGVYGMVGTYQTAYLKANWPLPFMTFLINSESGATSKEDGYNYKVAEYVEEARALGLKVLPPCVRRSGPLCSMIWPQQAIRFGLSMIKKVAEGSVEWIIRNCRKAESLRDFIISCYSVEKNDKDQWKAYNKVNKTNLEALCAAGAFDCYDKDRDRVAYLIPILSKWAEKYWDQHCKARNGKKVRVTPEQILDEMNKALFADEVPEGSLEKQLEAEREVTGCFLSQSPFEPFRETIRQYCNCTPSEITEGSVDGAMVFVGMVSQCRPIIIKNGKNKGQEMGIVKFQGIGGDLEAAAFMETWARQKKKSGGFERGKVYIVHVKPDRNGRGYIIEDATRLSGCGYGE